MDDPSALARPIYMSIFQFFVSARMHDMICLECMLINYCFFLKKEKLSQRCRDKLKCVILEQKKKKKLQGAFT